MRILVTGASGVIGQRAVPLLLLRGHTVTAVGRSRERLEPLARIGASTAIVDLFDRDAVQRAVEGQEVVINLATHVPPNNRLFLPGAWKEMDRVRRDASSTLCDAAVAAGVRRFVQESFAPIYPDSGAQWITEETPPTPARYNRSVLDAEGAARRFSRSGGAGIVLRFAFLYGPGDPFAGQLIGGARKGWLPLFGAPDGYFPMVVHDDAAAAAVAAMDLDEGIFNVVDDEPLTRREIAETLASQLGVRAPRLLPRWMAKLGGSLGETLSRSLRVSNQKLRNTGWTPSVRSVREGLRASTSIGA